MRILLVTDAWLPQVNGVVRTLTETVTALRERGHAVEVISPDRFRSIPCPTYNEIRLALTTARRVGRLIEDFAPDAVHIATEGPLGHAARRWCIRHERPFTTAYHTQFPDYLARRTGLSPKLFWPFIRRFHRPAQAVLTATPTIRAVLAEQGIAHSRHWGRGVDLDAFSPHFPPHPAYEGLARPIQLYVGRVAPEKNVEAFLATRQPGTRVVVGDGPARRKLEARYPDAVFLGGLRGEALASAYAGADVFVFPSRTDTFGLVLIEALASGLPVAAYPVPGPIDVLTDEVGAIDDDLDRAIAAALTRERAACIAHAEHFGWAASVDQFVSGLAALRSESAAIA